MKNWLAVILFSICACANKGGTTTGNPLLPEDESASGSAASALGGALSTSNTNGTLVSSKPQSSATASSACPTFHSPSGSDCTESGSDMWLSYNACRFGGSRAVWQGVQQIHMSTGTAACGTFPNPGASGSLYRQFVTGSGTSTPSYVQLVSAYGTVAAIDHSSANLGNFDGQTISTIRNGGYGVKVDFNGSGARSSITFGHRVVVPNRMDQSITGTLSITESAGAVSRLVNGTMTVYHNGLQVVGTTTFSSVVHEDICCLPTSGTITTSFAAGANVSPTVLGAALVGHSETLTFTSCGRATFTGFNGVTKAVSLSRCY